MHVKEIRQYLTDDSHCLDNPLIRLEMRTLHQMSHVYYSFKTRFLWVFELLTGVESILSSFWKLLWYFFWCEYRPKQIKCSGIGSLFKCSKSNNAHFISLQCIQNWLMALKVSFVLNALLIKDLLNAFLSPTSKCWSWSNFKNKILQALPRPHKGVSGGEASSCTCQVRNDLQITLKSSFSKTLVTCLPGMFWIILTSI